jgi:hypothetical protein
MNMHAHTQKLRVFGLAVLTLLVFVAAPGRVLGDDGTSSGSAGTKRKGMPQSRLLQNRLPTRSKRQCH